MFRRSAIPTGNPRTSDGTPRSYASILLGNWSAVRQRCQFEFSECPLRDDPWGKDIHMATKYFIESENGTILSEDGSRRFIVLEGKELYDYLQTKEGKKKRFFVYQDDGGDMIGIEEVKNTTKGETKGERKTRYHNQVKSEINAEEVSLDDTVISDNGDEMPLAETIVDEEVNIEDEVVRRGLLEALRRVRPLLEPEERRLIDMLFHDDENGKRADMSGREAAKALGISQTELQRRKKSVLQKIKNLMMKKL